METKRDGVVRGQELGGEGGNTGSTFAPENCVERPSCSGLVIGIAFHLAMDSADMVTRDNVAQSADLAGRSVDTDSRDSP